MIDFEKIFGLRNDWKSDDIDPENAILRAMAMEKSRVHGMEKHKSYTVDELFEVARNGHKINAYRALATYADDSNWKTTVIQPEGGCLWVWRGPTVVGFELAQWALRERQLIGNPQEAIFCPFCGCGNNFVEHNIKEDSHYIRCAECGAAGPKCDEYNQCAPAWNKWKT